MKFEELKMQLCEHIQKIYIQELKRGNEILIVSTFKDVPAKIAVFMKNVLDDYTDSLSMLSTFNDTHYPADKQYFCKECGCYISGPLDKNQKGNYNPSPYAKPLLKVIATNENVFVEDGYIDSGMIPTIQKAL
jgi:hypothetical protein